MSPPRPPADHPGPHPEPPSDLARRPLPIYVTRDASVRIYRCDREPRYFGRTGGNRWDAPDGEYGVLYAGSDAHCAFVETFGQATGRVVVTAAALAQRCLAAVETLRPLQLVDLTGPGLAQLGADERLCAGPHAVAQRWALTLWSHPAQPDGLLYRARHDPSRMALALYDRAAHGVRVRKGWSLLDPRHRLLLADLLQTYHIAL